ncbi:MAG TPA: lasso peptide biosynthesis B2 protein [Pseudolabrys sp.]|nr:lasso peptide biosynthesis B2 protein [Pseudolabrys sp.]
MKLQARRRLYLREAFVMLLLARIALRVIAPARVFAWVDRPLKRSSRFAGDEVGWIAWAVQTIAAKWPAPCLPSALAAHAMLRRRGIASSICLAVAREDQDLAAHAWVEVGDKKIVGDPKNDRFTRIAEFGKPRTVSAMSR